MTLDEIRKKHNVGASAGQATEKPVETNTDAAGLAAIRKKHNVDNYTPSSTKKPDTTTNHTETSKPAGTLKPAGTVNIKAFGAYGSNGKQETTSRAGKTVNAGVQGTMSNFTNLFGWLKEADAMAVARDEADRAYTAQQNKELVESKGEKTTAKTSAEQKKVYNEAHAKQKDTWSKYYEKADELSAMSEKNTSEAKEGLGAVGQTLVDLGVVGTQMLGDAAANLIVPGGGAASMVARVAGGGAQQARLEGKDIGDQSKAAVKSGAISYLTEKMFGAFGKLYGKGAADDIVEKVVGKIGKSNAGRNALRLLLNSVGEGVEEMTEDLLNAAADKVLKLGDGKVDVGEVLYAVKEAQKATYRDLNTFSKWVSSLRIRTQNQTFNRVGNAIIEGVLPFKKTPANILARAVEYSPVGAVKTLTADTIKLRRGEITAAEYIDNLSQGLTGTALVGLGYLFAQMGVLSGGASGDDKQDTFDKLQGKQDYSMNIGDLNITLDWLAPESMPLFVGVELFNKAMDSDEPFSLEKALRTIEGITSPMLNMSMLQGVNEVIEGLDYSDSSALSTLIQKATGSLISQFVPTIFGQLERTFTENRQTTFIDRDSSISSNTQRFIGNFLNKVPIADYNQIPYIDAWGRVEETGNVWERGFNNLFNPAYVKNGKETPIDDELKRLYELGNDGVYPTKPGMNTKINGNYLTAEQYVEYAKKRGSLSLDTATKVIRNPAYHSMTDEQKAKAIEYAYSYANHKAKLSIDPNTKTPKWVKGSSPLDYIMEHAKD